MMKKILFIAMMLLVGAVTVEAQASKEYKKQTEANRKSAEKIAKKQAKELKKQKWQSTGAIPLETLLANYYLETEAMCGGEKRGQEHTVNDAKSISMAEKRLLLDAQAAYAQEVKTMLGATLTNQASSLGGDDVEAYVGNVAAKVQHEFKGDLKRAFMIYRQNPDGKTMTVRAFFIIDENAANVRAQQIADRISKNNEMSKEIEQSVFGE